MRIIIFVFFCLALLSCSREASLPADEKISIIYPDGPESFVKGSTLNILWQAPYSAQLRIELYLDSVFQTLIAGEANNSGRYLWAIPEDLPDGIRYQLKISDVDNSQIHIFNKKEFRLLSPGVRSSYTDKRDGQTYPTVQIGDQVWLGRNYNYLPEDGSYCYDGDTTFIERHGRLYTLESAMNDSPAGWHLPSDEEWKKLESYLGMSPAEIDLFESRGHSVGQLLRPDGGLGFNSIFSGYYNHCVDGFGHKSYESHYWTSSKNLEGKSIIRVLNRFGSIDRFAVTCHKACSVRYIKNRP